jgi:hypothetical protein
MDVLRTISTAAKNTPPDFYLAYLNTPDWRSRRNRALLLANWRCQRCASKRDLQVHHVTYERLGAEWDQDLEVVCRDCHEGHHIDEMSESEHRLMLKLASEVLHGHEFESIADLSDRVKTACVKARISYNAHQVSKALGLLCGVSRNTPTFQSTVGRTPTNRRPPTAAEAREIVHRLGLQSAIRTMPSAAPSQVDIYAPVYVEYVEHDRY